MKISLFPSTFALVVLVFTISVNPANGYEVNFENWGSPLKHNPTICAIKPTFDDLEDWEIERFMKQSKISSDEWEVKLKDGQKKSDLWEITYTEKSEEDDISECDITINFLPKAEDKNFEHGLLGLADYDPIEDKYVIKIYYLLGKLCYNSERIGDTIWYWYDPCFSGEIKTSDDLNITIGHELGHAFGLGHYAADDDGVNEQWAKGYAPAPSIMVKFELENFGNQQIRDDDIKKIKEIYGEKGFQAFTNDESFDEFRAQIFLEKDLLTELISYSDKTLAKDSQNESALTFKGLALWELDKYDESIVQMDKALKKNPENIDALYTKGKWLKKSENIEKALDHMDIVIKLDSEHYKALSYKGLLLEDLENYEEAEEFYLKSFDVYPYYKTNLNRYAGLLSDFGQYDKAVDFYKAALEIDPQYKSALFGLANTLFDMENYEDALGFYDKVLKIDPNDTDTLYNKALVLEELGRDDEAKELFDKVESLEKRISQPEPEDQRQIDPPSLQLEIESVETTQIPDWVRGNAEWWAQGAIGDSDFVSGIQYLIKEGIMTIPETAKTQSGEESKEIPSWIKNNADWWSQGLITDGDFVKGIQYLVEQGIIEV
ncbi:MAG: tetratricopeptide repeat protein [Nitrosopumilaceae archaeon]|jgi:tetratricopeptide (TPR) repeat protein